MNTIDNSRCGDVRAMLSEYIDSTLPASRAWTVEKHLTVCPACSAAVRELQATVDLLHSAPRLDTSDHFMAALHARLDSVEPAAKSRLPGWTALRRWLFNADGARRGNRAPALSLGLAATAAVVMMIAVGRPVDRGRAVPPSAAPALTDSSVHVSIASSANSPFSDPAADNLDMRSTGSAGGATAPF